MSQDNTERALYLFMPFDAIQYVRDVAEDRNMTIGEYLRTLIIEDAKSEGREYPQSISIRERSRTPMIEKVCAACGVSKPMSEFSRKSKTKDGFSPRCRECFRARIMVEIDWLYNNCCGQNTRAKRLGIAGKITKDEILDLLKHQNGKCYYCGDDLPERFQMDHKQPLSRGGTNWIENIALTCSVCNTWKNRMTEDEYRIKMKKISEPKVENLGKRGRRGKSK